MKTLASLSALPNIPAVYALYGGRDYGLYAAYVGVADALRSRIDQHLVRRDSSVATHTTAVGLNPDYVTEVRWWQHARFGERAFLEAAELVAFDILQPCLRSRGRIQAGARNLYAQESFQAEMRVLFAGEPAGRLVIPTLREALDRISELERRVDALEARLGNLVTASIRPQDSRVVVSYREKLNISCRAGARAPRDYIRLSWRKINAHQGAPSNSGCFPCRPDGGVSLSCRLRRPDTRSDGSRPPGRTSGGGYAHCSADRPDCLCRTSNRNSRPTSSDSNCKAHRRADFRTHGSAAPDRYARTDSRSHRNSTPPQCSRRLAVLRTHLG